MGAEGILKIGDRQKYAEGMRNIEDRRMGAEDILKITEKNRMLKFTNIRIMSIEKEML